MELRNVILIEGKPFSGKTEISEFLEREFGLIPISTKSVLLEYDPKLQESFDRGIIPGDDIVIPAFERHMPRTYPMVIDTPRSRAQIHWLRRKFYNAELSILRLLITDEIACTRVKDAHQTARGARGDDSRLRERLIDYANYSSEVEIAAKALGITIYTVDASRRRVDVQAKIRRFCYEIGIRSRSAATA